MQLVPFTFLLCLLQIPTIFSLSSSEEVQVLHQIKLSWDDPSNALSDWSSRDPTPCSWTGVTCDPSSFHVTSISLPSSNLCGPFPILLCNLTSLSFISLPDNYINGSLPSDIATCRNLLHLDLSQNLLVGPLPSSLPSLPGLLYLDLSANNFSGPIPPSFASFPKLQSISLVANLLNDSLPPFLANVSTLKQLNLSYNPFAPSEIPPEYGNLTDLRVLWLAGANLYGPIPPSLGNLKNLTDLDLSLNNLIGPIPHSLTLLSSVVQIELYNNSLSGPLPSGMGNLTALRRFDASMNDLEGEIPDELCRLPLESLNLYENLLEGELPASIARSPNLYELRLFGNRLTGALPADLGSNSPLLWVDLADNLFKGEIPPSICEMRVLEELLLLDNSFWGRIPESLGECRSLTRVRLRSNRLSGKVPNNFWALPHVSLLELDDNSLSGEISPAISGASNLSLLLISNNRFSGSIPAEIGSLEKLVEFSGGNNQLSGQIPPEVGNLGQLIRLDLHNNTLSGELPREMKSWKKLSELNLANNEVGGTIPVEIGELPVLNYLDLSGNRFTGEIPLELQNLKLNRFNLSNNDLSGKIPPTFATEIYRDSFLGNPGLCGSIVGLCPSPGRSTARNVALIWVLRSIFMLAGIVLAVGIGCFFWRYHDFKQAKRGIDKSKWTLTSFHKLDFSEYEILGCLDEDNVIGSGASGKVYKAVLSNGETVAVKKLWGLPKKGNDEDVEAGKRQVLDDGFEAEVNTLGKIRHKNIVKLWCCCTAKDSKFLVYEYMPNGSLGDLLHSCKGGLLDWPTRFKIAVDAAEGLSYLHHDCVPPIVHRDVKSNNILLDADFGAKVADFGVAKVIGKGWNSMSAIAGSCGYIAPEYAYTLRVNEKSDIYSFGVVILELVTGKRSVDPEFGEKDLVKWVYTNLEQKGIDLIIDSKLDITFKEQIRKVLSVGLLCTSPLPVNRPTMRRVVKMLLEIGHVDSKPWSEKGKKDGKLTPYDYDDGSVV
ncbi:hypothetical protein ACLOJK_010386 [Asimina triloba]